MQYTKAHMDLSRLRRIAGEGFAIIDERYGPTGRPSAPPPPPQNMHRFQHQYQQPHTYYIVAEPTQVTNSSVGEYYYRGNGGRPVATEKTVTTMTSDQAAGAYGGFSVVEHGRKPWTSRGA